MALAQTFQTIVDSLPDDWTDLELDLRLVDESRYVEAAVYLTTCNAQPYSHHDWHWRLLVAHRFGHAASAPTVHGTLGLLDDAGIEGELVVREVRSRTGRGHAGVGSPAVGARRLPPPARAVGAVSMARVLALVPDLLFGSQVQGMLAAAGDEVDLVGEKTACGTASGMRARRPSMCSWWTSRPTLWMARRSWKRSRARARSSRHAPSASTRMWMSLYASVPRRPGSTSSFLARGWPAKARCSSGVWRVDARRLRRFARREFGVALGDSQAWEHHAKKRQTCQQQTYAVVPVRAGM